MPLWRFLVIAALMIGLWIPLNARIPCSASRRVDTAGEAQRPFDAPPVVIYRENLWAYHRWARKPHPAKAIKIYQASIKEQASCLGQPSPF